MNQDEYHAAMVEIEKLMDSDPAKGTKEGERLEELAVLVQEHERGILAIARKREKVWARIVKEPLFQFLKHGDGRIILELYANEQISLGKAAEAITEKFCLKLEPLLPDWKGCNVEE